MVNYIYIDGRFYTKENAKISVYDHGLLYGDGVFEGIRAYNGRVFRLDEHIDRMFDGARAIMLTPPVTKEKMKEIILETLRKNNLRDAYIRPVITRGVGDLGLDPNKCPVPTVICIAETWGAMYGDLYEKGLNAITVSIRRNAPQTLPPNIKSLNYLNNILAKIEANVKGGNEAIIFDINGNLSEGSGDNIFIIKRGQIRTPIVEINLRGVTRGAVFDLAEKLKMPLAEADMSYYDLYTADEIFVTGTAAEICPVTRVDGRVVGDGKPGPMTKKLMAAYKKLTMTTGTPIYKK